MAKVPCPRPTAQDQPSMPPMPELRQRATRGRQAKWCSPSCREMASRQHRDIIEMLARPSEDSRSKNEAAEFVRSMQDRGLFESQDGRLFVTRRPVTGRENVLLPRQLAAQFQEPGE